MIVRVLVATLMERSDAWVVVKKLNKKERARESGMKKKNECVWRVSRMILWRKKKKKKKVRKIRNTSETSGPIVLRENLYD